MSSPLHLDVFVAPYKPIVGLIPPMSEGVATWPATAVSLISGERDAVLIDALITRDEAERVVDWIRASGKNLTTVYITHGHGDHFFGLNTILDAFPDAKAVTVAAVVPDAQTQLSPELMGSGTRSSGRPCGCPLRRPPWRRSAPRSSRAGPSRLPGPPPRGRRSRAPAATCARRERSP